MKLSFKEFFKKTVDDYKESQTPEAIKEKIEKEKLLMELDEVKEKRRKANEPKWNMRIGDKDERMDK